MSGMGRGKSNDWSENTKGPIINYREGGGRWLQNRRVGEGKLSLTPPKRVEAE